MSDLTLRFEFEPGTDLDATARIIKKRVAALKTVAAVDARPDDARISGLEIVGAIAVGVQIVRGSRQLVAEVRRLIADLKGLRGSIAGLRTIALDASPKPLAIDHVTDTDIALLIEESAAAPTKKKAPKKDGVRRRTRTS
jgi:hypothetical protein